MNPRRPAAVALAVASLLVASCGGDGSSDPTTATTPPAASTTDSPTTAVTTTTEAPATTTTLSIDEAAMAYTDAGPYPVGVTTLALADGTPVEVWYPAVAGTTGTESYDVRDFTPDALKALLVADVPVTVSYPAGRDADVADGSFPVVLFSHGFIGFRLQSTFLTSHLASWGTIVVAPDHPSRDLLHILDLIAAVDDPSKRPADTSVEGLLGSLDLITAEGSSTDSRFSGHVDGSRVVALGHSAGGGTALRAAADDRIDGYVSMASGALGAGTDSAATLPAKPSFFIAGTADSVVPADTVTTAAFKAAPAPSLLWVIDGAGHQAFSDLCTVGNGAGIIGVARANGLGEFLDGVGTITRLGEDGCLPPALPVATTFPIIDHAVTAWIRQLFGLDAEPVGLGPGVASAYATPVEIEVK